MEHNCHVFPTCEACWRLSSFFSCRGKKHFWQGKKKSKFLEAYPMAWILTTCAAVLLQAPFFSTQHPLHQGLQVFVILVVRFCFRSHALSKTWKMMLCVPVFVFDFKTWRNWCSILQVMTVYIIDHLMYKKFGPAKVARCSGCLNIKIAFLIPLQNEGNPPRQLKANIEATKVNPCAICCTVLYTLLGLASWALFQRYFTLASKFLSSEWALNDGKIKDCKLLCTFGNAFRYGL